jgi:hypothetical protein
MLRIVSQVAFSLVVSMAILGAGVARAQPPTTTLAPDPMIGAWTLNLEKSKYVTPAPKSMTVTITPAARGYTFTIDAIGADGQPQKWSYTSAFDGSETPVSGNPAIDAVVATSTGSGGTVRYKKAGNVITTTTSTVSDDGKTLFVTAIIPVAPGQELTNLSVYERQ